MAHTELRAPGRLAYLDNLRSFVIFLVVVMHSNVTYSGLGGWYYKEGSPNLLDPVSRAFFGLYGSFTQAWFMGALFFVAAYFAARSVERRGPAVFVRERLFRLGLPLVIYVFVIHPCIVFVLLNGGNAQSQGLGAAYLGYLGSLEWTGSTGPLWFAEVLLVFCLTYAVWRAMRPRTASAASDQAPSALTLAAAIGATGLVAFLIRLVQPIGTAVLNIQLSFFASYVALFVLGLHAGERNWLDRLSDKVGLRWFTAVLGAGLPIWALMMVVGGVASGQGRFEGGLNGTSFVYAFWEAFVAIGSTLGIVVFFRRFVSGGGKVSQTLAALSFGVYTLHAPVLVSISLLARGWAAPLVVKHLVIAPVAFGVTMALSLVASHIPGLKRVLR